MSTMIQRVIAIAAMIVTTAERVKAVVRTCSIDSIWTEGDENRPPQGTGRSQVVGGKIEKKKRENHI